MPVPLCVIEKGAPLPGGLLACRARGTGVPCHVARFVLDTTGGNPVGSTLAPALRKMARGHKPRSEPRLSVSAGNMKMLS